MLVMVPVVFLLNGFVKGDFKQAFLFAIAVAVGLTPEMLPMVVTANLARGAVAMSRHKVIVKRLNAIQNLGAMDVLCTDKTGTLTQDKVVLEKHLNLTGTSDLRVLELAYLNSYYQTGLKNLLDRAVLEHVELAHEFDVLQHYTKVDEIPFDFTRRRMSVVVANGDTRHVLICKGAVEEMLTVCSGAELGADVVALSSARQQEALGLGTRPQRRRIPCRGRGLEDAAAAGRDLSASATSAISSWQASWPSSIRQRRPPRRPLPPCRAMASASWS